MEVDEEKNNKEGIKQYYVSKIEELQVGEWPLSEVSGVATIVRIMHGLTEKNAVCRNSHTEVSELRLHPSVDYTIQTSLKIRSFSSVGCLWKNPEPEEIGSSKKWT